MDTKNAETFSDLRKFYTQYTNRQIAIIENLELECKAMPHIPTVDAVSVYQSLTKGCHKVLWDLSTQLSRIDTDTKFYGIFGEKLKRLTDEYVLMSDDWKDTSIVISTSVLVSQQKNVILNYHKIALKLLNEVEIRIGDDGE